MTYETKKEFIEFLETNNLIPLNSDDEIINMTWNSKVKLKCNVCSEEFEISLKQLLRPHPLRVGCVCPKCSLKEKFLAKMTEKYKRIPYEFLSEFKSYEETIKVKCKDCGEEWEASAKSLLMNSKLSDNNHPCRGCTILRRQKKQPIDVLYNELSNKFGECNYELINPEKFTGMFSKEKYDIRCKICGHEFNTYLNNILNPSNGKHYCRVCNNKNRLLDEMEYKDRCLLVTHQQIEPIEEYVDSKTKIKHKCNICGYGLDGEWLKIPVKNTERNAGCPRCANKFTQSKAEKEIIEYIKEIYKGEVLEKDKTIFTDGKEIDIYVPELKIGFEYDGLYWHNENYKGKKYHIEKTLEAKKLGVRLVHIFEDEWRDKKDICKDKIANILKCTQNKKIYARKCEITENINPKDKNQFFDKYHIQGKDSASIIVGLKYENEIVAIMTFAKPRVSLGRKSGNIGEYELSRFACSCNVVGGFSKLMKYAIKKYDIKIINTYADIRWSSLDENVYVKNGFKQIHLSTPGYWYFKRNDSSLTVKRIHRFNFRKQELKEKFPDHYSDDKTEFQIMQDAGYLRIWDCGNIVFRMEINNNEEEKKEE